MLKPVNRTEPLAFLIQISKEQVAAIRAAVIILLQIVIELLPGNREVGEEIPGYFQLARMGSIPLLDIGKIIALFPYEF